ncbi:MAG: formimidoylglutamase [Henriciella sp.]|nr:formimidoylglutamase [Henriciella sp.]
MSASLLAATAWTGRTDPEDGLHALRLHQLETEGAKRGLIGFACDAGVARNKGRVGAKEAPQVIRSAMANLAAPIQAHRFTDLGTVTVDGDALEQGQAMLADLVARSFDPAERLVVLGGGHETALGSYSGLRQARPQSRIGIINLDAHLDLRAMGSAGASSGTPFFQIRDLDPERFDYLCLGLAQEANTQALVQRASDWGVRTVYDRDMERDVSAAKSEIDGIFARNDLVYLTIDIDVLPHFVAPGVSAPAARGVSLSKIEAVVDHILDHAAESPGKLPLADIVEVCPRLDQDNATARVAAYLARKLLIS